MPLSLHFKDLDAFEQSPSPKDFASFKNWSKNAHLRLSHHRAGSVGMNIFTVPHLQVVELSWKTGLDPIRVHGHAKTDRSIGVSFHLSGSMDTRFQGINTALQMRPGCHNLVFTPETGDEHLMPGNDTVNALQMNLDEHFFKSCIGTDNAWSEQTLLNLEKDIPFSGVANAGEMTPAMRQVIQSILQLPQGVPMRNLLIQSRSLELLALQFEQFAQIGFTKGISVEDAEKLHQLKAYLDQYFLEDLSLTGLCRHFFINEFKLKKGFKQLFGDTVFSYLRHQRMNYAVRMLRNGNISIDQVAYELGYEHAQHFSTAFRKHFGDSPSAYIHRKIML